ncbi:MAG: hypothetical protein ACKVQB_05825 [Bacteroidia bacterium]
MKKSILLLASIFAFTLFAKAQLQTKSVSVFKNNKAFFIKSGTVTPKGTIYQLEGEIPRALFGTLWFQSPGIKMVTSDEQNVEKQGLPLNHYEILKANLNKKVFIFLSPTETVEGTVQSFSKEYDEETKTWFIPAFVTLKPIFTGSTVSQVWQTIRIEDIKRIGFAENPVNTVTTYEKKKVVSVEFTESKPQTLNMMYLQDGLGWNPNYLLELTSENKGILTLQAQVKNDAEDIKNTDVSFVVGNANFKDANKLAWLVDFLPSISWDYGDGGGKYDNTQLYKGTFSDVSEAEPASKEGDGVDGESTEDLFFYILKNLNLPKGSRAQMELFKAEISFEHIYQVNLTDMSAYNFENYVYQIYATEEPNAKTYHSLKLSNQTKYPWTAGLCFVVSNEKGNKKPISQDILSYTPMKGDNSLKLTESPDIKVSQTEREIDRKTNVRKRGEIQYDLITVEAEIKIKNYKSKDVKMNVNRLVSGELLKSNVDWKKTDKINYSNYLNKSTALRWETFVKAGEEKIIRYTYTVVVRTN